MPKILCNNKGFTIMETVVSLLVISIVMTILMGVYVYTDKMYLKNLAFSSLQLNSINVAKTMERNLLNCRGVVLASEKELAIQKPDGKVGTYEWNGENLSYNHIKLGSSTLKISNCTFEYAGKPQDEFNDGSFADFTSIDRNNDGKISLEETGLLKMVRVTLLFADKKDTCNYSFNVHIRGKAVL